ncbi:IQ-DOMAIN 9-like protein [Drosera capensis]
MGSGRWFKAIIRRKKGKKGKFGQSSEPPAGGGDNGFMPEISSQNGMRHLENGNTSQGLDGTHGINIEDLAAIHIQTAYRAYKARKTLQRMKGAKKLQIVLSQGPSVKKQSMSTLTYLHSWGRIQSQIRERRLYMVTEGRLKQKRLETQKKFESKLHDLEVEWCDGSETMEEILARIHQREEAAVKRERAMAYAFSHQVGNSSSFWRANCSLSQGLDASDLSKSNWGWSWKERWIAARPWENRVVTTRSIGSKKGQNKLAAVKAGKSTGSPITPKSDPAKPSLPNGKQQAAKARRSSFPGAQKPSGSKANPNKAQEADVSKGSNGTV